MGAFPNYRIFFFVKYLNNIKNSKKKLKRPKSHRQEIITINILVNTYRQMEVFMIDPLDTSISELREVECFPQDPTAL